jgi:hypothetical protein
MSWLLNTASSAPGRGVSILSRISAPRAQDLDREVCRPRSTHSGLLPCRRRRHIPVAPTAPLLSVVRATVGGGVTLETGGPCGEWMPRKKTRCARKPGHGGPCKTSEAMALAVERQAESVRVNGRRRYPETRRRWRQAYKLWRYGLTQEQFGRLLEAQQNACGMCHEPFAEGSPICVDHDHTCCPGRRCRAASAFAGCCAGRATPRWGTSSGSPSWPACTWQSVPPGSSRSPRMREGPGKDRVC